PRRRRSSSQATRNSLPSKATLGCPRNPGVSPSSTLAASAVAVVVGPLELRRGGTAAEEHDTRSDNERTERTNFTQALSGASIPRGSDEIVATCKRRGSLS